jgi:hypothetical protein
MGSPSSRLCCVLTLMSLACSSSSLDARPKRDAAAPPTDSPGAEWPPLQPDAAAAFSPDTWAASHQDAAPVLQINLDVRPGFTTGPDRDTAGDLGSPLCPEAVVVSADASTVPADAGGWRVPGNWQSAQWPSAWCGAYGDSLGGDICLSQTSDGYHLAVLDYVIGGEMWLVDRNFFLYDPTSGEMVAGLVAHLPGSELTCLFRTPGGPANPAIDARDCQGTLATPLQSVCPSDAGHD